jgi:hypothetical protein
LAFGFTFTLEEYMEMNLLRRRLNRLEGRSKRFLLDLTKYQHNPKDFNFGPVTSIDELIEKLSQIREIYGER